MSRRKCPCCNEWIEAGDLDLVPYKGRYAHSKCFNLAMKMMKHEKDEKLEKDRENKQKKSNSRAKKSPIELKNGLTEEEYQIKRQFYEYVKGIIGDNLDSKIYAISENIMKKFGFTFESMHKTLVYLKELRNYEFSGEVVGIIPYYHDEAMRYYKEIENVEEKNKSFDTKNAYKKKVIYIQPQKKRTSKTIDITSIVED